MIRTLNPSATASLQASVTGAAQSQLNVRAAATQSTGTGTSTSTDFNLLLKRQLNAGKTPVAEKQTSHEKQKPKVKEETHDAPADKIAPSKADQNNPAPIEKHAEPGGEAVATPPAAAATLTPAAPAPTSTKTSTQAGGDATQNPAVLAQMSESSVVDTKVAGTKGTNNLSIAGSKNSPANQLSNRPLETENKATGESTGMGSTESLSPGLPKLGEASAVATEKSSQAATISATTMQAFQTALSNQTALGAQTVQTPVGQSPSQMIQSQIQTPISDPNFPQAFASQVSILSAEGITHAELTLNPPNMGPVQIEIRHIGSNIEVNFRAEQAHTREAIKASVEQLRELLQDQGMALQSSVVRSLIVAPSTAAADLGRFGQNLATDQQSGNAANFSGEQAFRDGNNRSNGQSSRESDNYFGRGTTLGSESRNADSNNQGSNPLTSATRTTLRRIDLFA